MRRPIAIVLGLMLLASMLAANPANAARGGNPPEDAIGYWTAERVQNATPRDIVLDANGNPSPQKKPDKPGKPDGGGEDGGGGEDTGDVKGAPWPEDDENPTDDIVGRVLFTLGTGDYVCSGSSVDSGNDTWVVMTAGHCTWDDGIGPATNFVFVPDYEDVGEFGCRTSDDIATNCYTAKSLHPTVAWMADGNDYANDVAFVSMQSGLPSFLSGVTLPAVDKDRANHDTVTAFGYPAAGKKYNGDDLIYCLGTSSTGVIAGTVGLACDMTGGSSGGPWYIGDQASGRVAVSLNSHGFRNRKGYMFGPDFTQQALDALALASK